jgi:hypothetical protein
VFFFYKSAKTEGQGKSFAEIGRGMWKVLTNARLMI